MYWGLLLSAGSNRLYCSTTNPGKFRSRGGSSKKIRPVSVLINPIRLGRGRFASSQFLASIRGSVLDITLEKATAWRRSQMAERSQAVLKRRVSNWRLKRVSRSLPAQSDRNGSIGMKKRENFTTGIEIRMKYGITQERISQSEFCRRRITIFRRQ